MRILTLFIILISWTQALAAKGAEFIPFDVLYHGSPNSSIEIIKPYQLHLRDSKEGAVIFASPSIKVASCFLFKWDNSWVNLSVSTKDADKADFEVFMVISEFQTKKV